MNTIPANQSTNPVPSNRSDSRPDADVIVAGGGPADVCAAIAAAHSFDGAENLESWTVAASGNRPGSVLLSADGKSLYLSLVSPTVISFR